jgi:two-component system OmpR family response regulator
MRFVIVEDNESLARAIAYRLRDRGHSVDLLADGDEAAAFLRQDGADLAILDVNLPGTSGLELLRQMRERGDATPVLMLTARGETADRVAGLDAGADDYLVKPFEMEELEARLRALARRRNTDAGVTEPLGPLSFDRGARTLSHEGQPVEIPRRELSVLECLMDNRGRLVSKSRLMAHVYGTGAPVEESAVEPHISRLRRRLGVYGITIKSARGLGYMIETE